MRLPWNRLSLRLIAPVLLAVIPVLVLHGAFFLNRSTEARQQAVEASADAVAHALNHHRSQVERARQVLAVLAGRDDIVAGGPTCDRALADLLGLDGLFLTLGVLDTRGDVICSALPTTGPVNAAHRLYFQDAIRSGEFAVGEFQVGLITGQPSVNVGYPVMRPVSPTARGVPRGVVFAALNLQALGAAVASVGLPPAATLLILDHEDRVLVATGDLPALGDPTPVAIGAPLVLAPIADYIVATSAIGSSGAVAVVLPRSAVVAPLWARLRNEVTGTLGALFLGLVAALVLADRSVVRPLHDLRRGMQRVAGGDYSARLQPPLGEELAVLARGFNAMALAIEEHREAARLASVTDPVTGLLNRPGFQSWVDDRTNGGAALACVYLTVSDFHEITATFGYPAADRVLREVGSRLRAAFEYAAVARIAGNSFAVAVPRDTPHDDLAPYVHQVQALLATPITVRDVPLYISALVGGAGAPEHDRDADMLLRKAELAARSGGDRHLVFDPATDEPQVNNVRLVSALRQAIADDTLLLHYQPVVDREGRIHGVEALARWLHEDGWISPGTFVPLAERSGTIRDLDRWVFRTAARQSAAWAAEGLALPVSINVSARTLEDPEFPDYALAVLRDLRLSPARFIVEITETAALGLVNDALDVCRRLRDAGFGLAIDDFGSGHSPVQYLRQFPVSRIKFDNALTQAVPEDDGARIIMGAFVRLAHDLGIETVGEGVETGAMRDALLDLTCDLAQGYHFSAALPAADLRTWAHDH